MAKAKKTTVKKEVKRVEVMGNVKVAASKETIGLALTLKKRGNDEWIACRVSTVYLSIVKGMKGKCEIQASNKSYDKLEEYSKEFKETVASASFAAAVKFLNGKYDIEGRAYNDIKAICETSGTLYTKAEMKAIVAEERKKREAEKQPKAVVIKKAETTTAA